MRLISEQKRAFVAAGILFAALAALSFQTAGAQGYGGQEDAGSKMKPADAADVKPHPTDVAGTLKTAAEKLGLARWSGVGGQRLPEVDALNTMEFWASGSTHAPGQSKEYKTEYHAALGYNPPGLRLEMTRTAPEPGSAAQHTIQVVREKYAWDESEIGAGLIPGKGVATPQMGAVKNRLLQLWILPYGVIKAAVAAGDKTKMTTENGATVLTFPLSGLLADVRVRATLGSDYLIAKVETQTDNPALKDLITETEYSGYADHGEILTDVKSPGHILQKQGGHPVLDIQVKMWDANNPYQVFPVPENVKKSPST